MSLLHVSGCGRPDSETMLPSAATRPASSAPTVEGGKVVLGARPREVSGLESVETHRMPDAFDALESP